MTKLEHLEKLFYFRSNPEWVWYDDDDIPHLTEKATPEAKESYDYWKERYDRSVKTGILYD